MHAEERHQAILRRLRDRGSLRVSDFAAELGVSPVTVRRDVESLAERGIVDRVHGGAMLPESPASAQPVTASASPSVDSQVFGMIVPAADYYYPEVIKGAREAAAARGIRLVLGISGYQPAEEQDQARQMLADGVDGLLVTPCGSAEQSRWMDEVAVPLTLVERRPDDDVAGVERVVTDHVHGARLAVRHLLGSGRERIALVLRAHSPHARWVKEGYRTELASSGHQATDDLFFPTSPPDPDDAQQLAAFLAAVADSRVDAALVHNDHDAIMLLQRLRMRGISVPQDLAIVAYDDDLAALADIPLTAVAPPKQAVGAAAVDLLAARVADPERPRHRLSILPELHIRASSG